VQSLGQFLTPFYNFMCRCERSLDPYAYQLQQALINGGYEAINAWMSDPSRSEDVRAFVRINAEVRHAPHTGTTNERGRRGQKPLSDPTPVVT
jgi:hypothetical protein